MQSQLITISRLAPFGSTGLKETLLCDLVYGFGIYDYIPLNYWKLPGTTVESHEKYNEHLYENSQIMKNPLLYINVVFRDVA
jgi:hypothetical protein